MPSNHLVLCRLLLLSSVSPSIRVFSNELALYITFFPDRLLQNIEYSSMCYIVGLCCSSILYIAIAKSLQSCPTLRNPIDGSPPGSPIPGILQARTLEWVAISFSNAWKWKVEVKSLSHVRLSDPMDCSLPGSFIHGIFQARVLEWGAIAFSVLACEMSPIEMSPIVL